jgi:hypothetical protein
LAKVRGGLLSAAEHRERKSHAVTKVAGGSFERTLIVTEHEIGVVDAAGDLRIEAASFVISGESGLQKTAVAADVSESGKDVGIASAQMGAVEEAFHGIQRAALIDLELGVKIVRKGEVGVEPEGLLKVVIGGTKTFAGTEVVLIPKPAGAAEPGPSRRVRRISGDALFVDLNRRRQVSQWRPYSLARR